VADTLKAVAVPHIDQSQESDAVFLSRLADRNGAAVSVKAGKLLFLKAGSGKTASGKPIPQMTLERGDGDRHQFAIADREAYTGVTAKWLHTKDPKPQKQKVKLKQAQREAPPRAAAPESDQSPGKGQSQRAGSEGEYMAGEADNVLELTTIYATKAQACAPLRRSGTSCAALRSFQSRWRLAGQIYFLKRQSR
jgi:phage protein D